MNKDGKIFVAGHNGLVGSALIRKLKEKGFLNLVVRNRQELDLTDQAAVRAFFQSERPDYVFLAAAKVGGIMANSTRPAEFIYENIMIEANIIRAAYENNVKKLLFLGSTCIYPKMAPQPMKEEALLTGALEPTNQAYAVAKIAGIEMCRSFNQQYGTEYISIMPTNLYGPNDNFDLMSSHVLPALIRKFHEAKTAGSETVEIWGTGTPIREFLHVDDLAEACLFLMDHYSGDEIINIGYGEGLSIKDLATLIGEVLGFSGRIVFNPEKPDGTPIKVSDIGRIRSMGWAPKIHLREGIQRTYQWYLQSLAD